MSGWDTLTGRQVDVAVRYAKGMSRTEIALELGCTDKTVDSHRQAVMRRLDVDSNAALTLSAIKHGMITIENDALHAAIEAMPTRVLTMEPEAAEAFQNVVNAAVKLLGEPFKETV